MVHVLLEPLDKYRVARWQHTCSDTGYSELLTFEQKPNYKAIPSQVLTD